MAMQFGLRARPAKKGDLSLRLKNGHARDDAIGLAEETTPLPASTPGAGFAGLRHI